MNSSFVSNNYFDGGLNISSPVLGLGIKASYTNTSQRTNTQQAVHSTCVFHYPRAEIALDTSYLKPSQEFLDALDNVIDKNPRKKALEEVLATYGHVYPRRVVLGGHLFHTETHQSTGLLDEYEMRANVEARFKCAYIKGLELGAGGGTERRSTNEQSTQTSLITFQAVGGDTTLCQNPTAWQNTVRDPRLWRVIQREDYQPVLTLLPPDKQQAIAG